MPHPTLGKIGWCSTGGGFSGYNAAVYAYALLCAGIGKPTVIESSSVSALTALAWTEQPGIAGAEKALHLWEEYFTSFRMAFRYHVRAHLAWLRGETEFTSVFDTTPLQTILERYIDLEACVKSSIEWHIIAKRFSDATPIIFLNRRVGEHTHFVPQDQNLFPDLKKYEVHYLDGMNDAINARKLLRGGFSSIGLYPVIKREEIGGQQCSDSDAINPLPVDSLFYSGCDTIFVFLNMPKERQKYVAVRPVSSHQSFLEIAGAQAMKLMFDFEWLYGEMKRELVEYRIKEVQSLAKKYGKKLFILRPERLHPDMGLFSNSSAAMAHQKEVGMRYVADFVEHLEENNLGAP